MGCRAIKKNTEQNKAKNTGKLNILSYHLHQTEKNNCLGRTELAGGKTLQSCEVLLKVVFLAELVWNAQVRGGHWGVPNTAIPQKISINTVIPQKKSANIAIPHRKSMKYRNRKNVVYYSHYALQLTRIAWFRI